MRPVSEILDFHNHRIKKCPKRGAHENHHYRSKGVRDSRTLVPISGNKRGGYTNAVVYFCPGVQK